MDCVVPLCFPPVRADLFVWICAFAPTMLSTGHAIPWLQEKSCTTLSSAQKPRFRVNTRTLLKPVLQESSALGDYTAPKQHLT